MQVAPRTMRSIDMLKELYSVVIGLALIEAIQHLLQTSPTSGLVVHHDRLIWFIALFVTLLPFYHGALRYLDDVYIFAKERPKKFALLVDYLILFSEGCLLAGLGLLIGSPREFTILYALLLGTDAVWAGMSHFLTPKGLETSGRWLGINLGTLLVIAVVTYTPVLAGARPYYLVCLACLRTIVDYALCWKVYFPDA